MMTVTIYCSDYGFKAVGKTPVFDGYLKIYGKTDKDEKDDEESVKMPAMNEGDELLLSDIKAEQKFTKPPLRYTESSLVKAMEENGIGRPSTYATILTTLYNRKYMEQEKKTIIPTQLGFTVTEYLEKYFSDIVDTEFTAQMENKLDNVEEKGDNWTQVIDEFYKPFNDKLKNAMHGEAMRIEPVMTEEKCEKCGANMLLKDGPYGQYLACSNYPECKNIKSLKPKEEAVVTDILCEKCGKPMVEKMGRYGKYLACSGYPECKNIKSLKPKEEPKVPIFYVKNAVSQCLKEMEDMENISPAVATLNAKI
jgi:Topoisomerase IA